MADDSRELVADEVRHWRFAIAALADLDVVAAPAAWQSLELYLRTRIRERLQTVVTSLAVDGARVGAMVQSGAPTDDIRRAILRLRGRYLQVETVLDFYGDAVSTRTNPGLASTLRGLDAIAVDSLEVLLRPLGHEVPPVLVYLDKGLGAAVLRAGVRLWDGMNPSPAAAIKLTRHNLSHPTALLHETGHQVAHQTGWNGELADAFRTVLARRSRELAELWASWSSEVAADVHAFGLAGFAPLPALANVVNGTTASVFRILPGDPHPFPWIRVMFNAALCRSWFGAGPWDRMARAWARRHPLDGRRQAGVLAELSMESMPAVVDACTRRRMHAFGGRAFADLVDPRRVAPTALTAFARQAGATLLESSYLRRRESLRTLAWLTTRPAPTVEVADRHRHELHRWLASYDTGQPARAA